MVRIVYYCLLLVSFPFVLFSKPAHTHIEVLVQQDTIEEVSEEAKAKINTLNTRSLTSDSINVLIVQNNPYLSVGDYLVGQSAGLYVQNPTAEPGTYQNIILRGLSSPQFYARDITNNQATVYVITIG